MSLFASLYPLAQKTTLTLLITTEGDQLRVNVTPHARDDAKGEKTLYPLSILAAPDELDRDFAEAIAIYEPSTQSVLDQARAASAANGRAKDSPALPAPGAKGNRGRKARNEPLGAADAKQTPAASDEALQETPPVDPRQTSIPGIDIDAANPNSGTTQQSINEPTATAEAGMAQVANGGDDAVDIF